MHRATVPVHRSSVTLDRARDLTRTGDPWLFRGRGGADRAIRNLPNAPVNHVGTALVVDDRPPPTVPARSELGPSSAPDR